LNPSGALLLPLFALAAGGLRSPWSFAAGALLLFGALAGQRNLRADSPTARLWFAWLLWSALSASLSAEPIRGLADLAPRLCGVGVFLLALSSDRERERPAFDALLLAGVVALVGAAALVRVPGFTGVGVLYPYYNYTAAFAALGFVFALASLRSAHRAVAILAGVAAAASGAWLLASGSRGGLLAAGVGTLVWLWRSGARKTAVASSLAAAAALAFLFASASPVLKLDRPWANLRPKLWKASVSVAADSPWIGEGPGQFDRGFLRHNFPASAEEAPTRYGLVSAHAHSEPLQELAETGVPGLLLLLLALFASLVSGWKRTDGPDPLIPACAALLTHGLFDNIFNLPALEWLFFAMLGLSASRGEEPGARTPGWMWAFGAVLGAASWWPNWSVERALAFREPARIMSALRVAPKDHRLWSALAKARLRSGDGQAAVKALSAAAELHPTHAPYPLMLAELLRDKGSPETVLALTRHALHLEPLAAQARLLRAEALLALGKKGQARAELEAFRSIAKPLPDVMKMRPNVRFILAYDPALAGSLAKRLGR
jgi:O-antigen ligase